jgi:hypothetical protein
MKREINISKLGYVMCGIIIVILLLVIQQKNTQLGEVNNQLNTLQTHTSEINMQLTSDGASKDDKISKLTNNEIRLSNQIDQLQLSENDLKIQVETLILHVNTLTIFDKYRVNSLERLQYPTVAIITMSLYEHPEIIGISAVLGGTMYFNRVYVLDEQYAYATFDDGHIDGGGLYKYVYENEEIKWSRILDHQFE